MIDINKKQNSMELKSSRRGIAYFVDNNRRALIALAVFAVLMLFFIIANPKIFLGKEIYEAIFRSLPIRIVLALPLVFVIVSREIDLSFVSNMTFSLWIFAATAQAGWNPFLCMLLAVLAGASVGLVNGILVNRIGLQSLMTTIGMKFLLAGLVTGGSNIMPIPLNFLVGTPFYNIFVGKIGNFPVQMIWAVIALVIAISLFNYHKFGSHIFCVGDNLESSQEMGIHTIRVKTLAFMYVGVASGFAGVLSGLVYLSFQPKPGAPDELMLAVLASIFIGGTPTTGGTGTVLGAFIGACTIRFIQTGIIEAGLTGFWTQFVNGFIVLLAVASHKFYKSRRKSKEVQDEL